MRTPDYQAINDAFCHRFYHWSLEDAYREVAENFPRLNKMKNPYIRRDLETLKLFSKEEQVKIIEARIKNTTNRRILKILDKQLEAEEIDLLKRFNLSWNRLIKQDHEINALFSTSSISPYRRIGARKLRSLIVTELGSAVDVNLESYGSDLRYETSIGSWRLQTWIYIESDLYNYHHQIYLPRQNARVILGRHIICLADWLGFPNHTTWCFLTEEDALVAAKTIVSLCSHFMSILPNLLEGLSPD